MSYLTNMNLIEHIIEPSTLLLAWQSPEERIRYIVGEIKREGDETSLTYLHHTKDFQAAIIKGFTPYPAFLELHKIHHNVIDAFMRRLPPRTRGDFSQYLEGLRLKPDAKLSDFALLGYSGAKLLSDSFSLIHPFDHVTDRCELLLEAAGYRYRKAQVQIDQPAVFVKDLFKEEEAIGIDVNGNRIGYVNRGLLPTFIDWLKSNRIESATVEKISGTAENPYVYLFVKILPG
ncbi:MAG: hypothetical protein ACHQJ6_08935 [Candidatus Berkiellales bacterium]